MVCPVCEEEFDGAPWMIYDRLSERLEVFCPDCALKVAQERWEEHQYLLRKTREN